MTEKEHRYEIRLSGSGGQGIVTAAIILAEAAGVYDGNFVCQTQSYGPEVRGGASKADVVISGRPVDYPKAMKPDLVLAMDQTACDTYLSDLKPDGLLVVDSTLVGQVPEGRTVAIPFTRIARNELGKAFVANTVALGSVGYLCQVISLKSLEAALMARVPKGTEKINREALRAGIRAAKQVDVTALPKFNSLQDEEL